MNRDVGKSIVEEVTEKDVHDRFDASLEEESDEHATVRVMAAVI